MTSNAKDTLWPAPFDTFEPPPISAASFKGEAAFWQTSISTHFMLLLAIFAVVGALTTREQRSPITRLVPYLAQEEMQALLDAPDPSTRMGVRDRAILHLAVCAGLRVSELTGLRTDDVAPQSASIRVRGKGRRERALPLWKTTAAALRAWLAIRGQVASPELFVNARGTPFSRWGVAYVLRRHTETADRKCLTLRGKQVSPHVLRHTCAMIVLQATKDIRKVSLWLGHSDLTTTEVYVRADPSEKLEAIEAVVPPSLRKGKFRPPDKLLALLKVKP
jgi:integrase/recombinase XerD